MQLSNSDELDLNFAMSKTAMVLRNSAWGLIKAKQIIPGDIVQINKGDVVPADMVLIKTNLLKVNHVILTGGESSINRDANDI